MIANRNQLWGHVVAQELLRSGIRDICISPGSRSTPLVLAVHAQKGLRVTTHLDERSAAFFALGISKTTRRPAALICTSGTAAANYFPAIVEANQARVPLLVLTADRPPELHNVGANQAIDQQHLYGRHVRWFVDAGLPQPTAARIRHLRALVCRAIAKTLTWPAGPVHVNFPFQEPLEPTTVSGDVPDDWHQGDLEARDGRPERPFLRVSQTRPTADEAALDEAATILTAKGNGVIVAGPRFPDDDFAEAVAKLSTSTGYPALADPVSGLRFNQKFPQPCVAYDAWLANPARRDVLTPDVIVRFGAAPTSKNLLKWIKEKHGAEHVVVSENATFGEETTGATHILVGDAANVAQGLAKRVKNRKPLAFASRIRELDRATTEFLTKEASSRNFEGAIIQRVVSQLPAGADLVVSSSLPIRDLDRFGTASHPLRVHANRGASGIDGVTSTALGIAHATGKKAVLVIGDIAFLHDLSALVTRQRLNIPLDIVVLDNDGGGIFEFLPIAKHEPPFTELFVTPHGMDLQAIATALGLETMQIDGAKIVKEGIKVGGARQPSRLVVVKTDRKANVEHRRELEAALDATLETKPEAAARAR